MSIFQDGLNLLRRKRFSQSHYKRGIVLTSAWQGGPGSGDEGCPLPSTENPLWQYFMAREDGPGIWKWTHYFEAYHRHLAKFVGQPLTMVEVGIYSGGSLGMWKSYFGKQARIHGVDIEPACKCYADDQVTIHIGDQEDRSFWGDFRRNVSGVQVLIDDGGHTPGQQMVTLEEMLPAMSPGSVYICEDIHGINNKFVSFAMALAAALNSQNTIPGQIPMATTTAFQQSICSVHFYPYMLVIEKNTTAPSRLEAPKRGTEWQPFLG